MAWTTEAILALLRTVLPHAPERFVLEHDGLRLVIGEGTTSDPAPGTVMPTTVMSAVPTSAQAAAAPTGLGPDRTIPEGGVVVNAPTVGHFYQRPDPGSPPFIVAGSVVEVGTTLGLIEVMKMFNAVPAPIAGRVHALLIEDGAFVEHGQPLLVIVPGEGEATRAGH